jgi:polyphosphate kinase
MQEERYYPKELSWLSFNERVLQEAADKNNPIVERVRFLGIFSDNMDEFYKVRVADVKRKMFIHDDDKHEHETHKTLELLEKIQHKVLKMTERFEVLYQEVFATLSKYNIFLIDQHDLDEYQTNWLTRYFRKMVLMHLAPILNGPKVNLVQRLNDSATYLFIAILKEGKKTHYATLQVPTAEIGRFVVIPPQKSRKKKTIILLDDIIKLCIHQVFKGFVSFDELSCYSFKMTRDSEYSINDEIDESYVEKMSDGMKQRLHAEPVRVVYDSAMPSSMIKQLKKYLHMSSDDSLIASGPYRNFRDFIGFPNVGRAYLENDKLPAISTKAFSHYDTVFDAISVRDILLYYPYHSFSHFTEFVRQAAFDPSVKRIRINIYRVASKSRIINSLIDAVDNGKKVTVVVELRARFDEENNIEWSKTMRDAGIRVVFGSPYLKIHSKLCVVSREEQGELIHYSHFGTGNFNEKTAKIYTDFSLFTRNQDLASEAVNVFDFIQHPYRTYKFQHLQVSPVNAKSKIQQLIRQEVQNVKEGRDGSIIFKVNNLVDKQIIDELYSASQAGVIIRAIVRGMCGLRPGVQGLSDNIHITSVVDRFLEHPRVMVFNNAGDAKVFISSADWMTRNMESRIEVGCPIYDKALIEKIIHLLDIQFRDTLKARNIDKDQQNKYVRRGNRKKLRSQHQIYNYLLSLESKSDTLC